MFIFPKKYEICIKIYCEVTYLLVLLINVTINVQNIICLRSTDCLIIFLSRDKDVLC